MSLKPYPNGSTILVKSFNFDEFTIEGYCWKTVIRDGTYAESIMYTIKRKDGFIWQVDHSLVRLKDTSDTVEVKGNFTYDELLDMYRNYRDLYKTFGDDEYIDKQQEIETRIKNKLSNRR
jgi:hypothetical protein